MNDLTLASLNTFGGALDPYDLTLRYKAIATYFNASSVDIIHFQEVFTYYHLYLLKSLLKSYPFHVYQKSYFGPKGGLVTLSRYSLEKMQHVGYVRHFVPYLGKSIVELFTQRGALITSVKGSNVTIVNTHMTAILNGNWSQNSKYYQELASEIDQFHQALKDSQRKITVASGDFNIAKGSDLFRRLIDCESLYDPFAKDLAPTRHQCFAAPGRKTNHIDYIFVFGDGRLYKVKEGKRVFTDKVPLGGGQTGYASDHIGLQISLEVK